MVVFLTDLLHSENPKLEHVNETNSLFYFPDAFYCQFSSRKHTDAK